MAARHQLIAYDPSYLALTIESELALAMLDRRLAAAALAEGVAIPAPCGETKDP
ncbi:hypothetical protein [Mesorhizobium sp. M0408]|uniref:hypothetical protein n=1 Tax=Mesorhizobium sp. M0408 TaxID=2956942 RepID=UPI00333B16D4